MIEEASGTIIISQKLQLFQMQMLAMPREEKQSHHTPMSALNTKNRQQQSSDKI